MEIPLLHARGVEGWLPEVKDCPQNLAGPGTFVGDPHDAPMFRNPSGHSYLWIPLSRAIEKL